jgi:hypothetical protein
MRSTALFLLPVLVAAAPLAAAETVPVPNFRSVELRGGGDVLVRPGAVQRVTIVNGSTQFTSFHLERDGQLKIDACNDRCPRNYDLRIVIESPRAPNVAVEGGGAITAAAGFAPQEQLSVAVNGGGRIDVRSISASRFNAAVNGGGKILLGPSSALAAAVNGGGDIRYSGNPAVTMAVRGGGSVSRGDR